MNPKIKNIASKAAQILFPPYRRAIVRVAALEAEKSRYLTINCFSGLSHKMKQGLFPIMAAYCDTLPADTKAAL